MATIGFIGLGNMGGPMAANLIKAGHDLTVFDLAEEAVERLVGQGAKPAATLAAAVREAEIVLTMLPAGPHVRKVYLEADGVLTSATPGALLIDCSTIDVATARDVCQAAEKAGFDMVDAPVSGGVAAAQAGTLTFMVGGGNTAFARAEPVLHDMGQKIVHAGPSGTGQAAKICNNMMLGITMIATCEAFLLADSLGLDRQKLFDIASNASGQSWSLTSYCPVPGPVPTSPANRDYQAGFTAAMMLKDLTLAREAAEATRTATPLGHRAAELYARFTEAGRSGMDFSGIITWLKENADMS